MWVWSLTVGPNVGMIPNYRSKCGLIPTVGPNVGTIPKCRHKCGYDPLLYDQMWVWSPTVWLNVAQMWVWSPTVRPNVGMIPNFRAKCGPSPGLFGQMSGGAGETGNFPKLLNMWQKYYIINIYYGTGVRYIIIYIYFQYKYSLYCLSVALYLLFFVYLSFYISLFLVIPILSCRWNRFLPPSSCLPI